MASSSLNSSSLLNRISENHLQCSICTERYNQPKALNCMHTFCHKCLVRYYKDAQKMPCPICREETQLPEEGVSGLKANFYIQSLLDDFPSCENKNKTTEDESKCQKHKRGIKLFYCVPCEKLICQGCTVVDHPKPEHHFIDRETAAPERRQKIKDAFPDYKRDIKICQQSLKISSNAKQKFGKNVASAMTEVNAKAEEIIAYVKREKDRIIAEIKTLEGDRNTRFDEHEKTVSRMLQEKQYSLEVAQDVVNNTSDSTFLELYPDMTLLKGQSVPQIDHSLSCLSFKQSKTNVDINLGKLDLEGKWELCREVQDLQGAFDIAASAQSDDLVVAEYRRNRVGMINTEGHYKKLIQVQSPRNIAAIQNQLVVVDNTTSVKIYNEDGTLAFDFLTVPRSQVGKTAVNLWSVAVKKDGTIIVGDVKREVITQHSPTDGSLLRTIPVRIQPSYMAIDSNDRVVVSSYDQHEVDIVDSNGAILLTIKPTITGKQVQFCLGVCCDSSGIYITVRNEFAETGHIHHYDAEGRFLSCIAQDLYNPHGITFTSDGQQLAVADINSVKMYHKV